jgi:hypothetical protein
MEQKNNNDKPSGISIAALITGILGLSIVPIILAIVDIRRIKRGESSSQGIVFDIVGIVLGVIGLLALVIVVISAIIIIVNLSASGNLFSLVISNLIFNNMILI